jgi:hypothetical protein
VSNAQSTIRDSRGVSFFTSIAPAQRESNTWGTFSLFVTSEHSTNVTISATSRSNVRTTLNVQVSPFQLQQVDFDPDDYELRGRIDFLQQNNDNEKPSPASFHIESDSEITVYALLRDVNNSDAWLVLPTDVLGTQHRILSYPTEVNVSFISVTEYHSQFVVVATEDSTTVTITASTNRLSRVNAKTHSVQLRRGQSYLVQAHIGANNTRDDLTGTLVESSKPVAVVSSHSRAQVPYIRSSSTRDVLHEQSPATEYWGKIVYVAPLRFPRLYELFNASDRAQMRVLANENQTVVEVNGGDQRTLNAGQFFDVPMQNVPLVVSATKPILVATIDRSANRRNDAGYPGDPSLIFHPPIEQYLTSYTVVCSEPMPRSPLYADHYISVIAPVGASTVTIDGNSVSGFTTIPGTGFQQTSVAVSAGVHRVQSDEPIGITIYGYGPAESYGYIGGMAFEKLYSPAVYVGADTIVASPGQQATLRVSIDSISYLQQLLGAAPTRISGVVQIRPEFFVPNDVSQATSFFPTLRLPFSKDLTDEQTFEDFEIARFPGIAVLGPTQKTTITLDSVSMEFRTPNGAHRIVVRKATLTLDSLCVSPKLRLFDSAIATQSVRWYNAMGADVGSSLPDGAEGVVNGMYWCSNGSVAVVYNGQVTMLR